MEIDTPEIKIIIFDVDKQVFNDLDKMGIGVDLNALYQLEELEQFDNNNN